MGVPWAIIGMIVIFGGAIAVVVMHDRKRRDAIAQVGATMGLKFEAKADYVLGLDFAQLPLFQKGHGKKVRNLLSGHVEDIDLRVFDYQYSIGTGHSTSTPVQTVAVVGMGSRALPAFEMRPERWHHRIGQMFGYQDIGFDEHPAFSKRYLLRGADEQAIRGVFTPELIEYLQQRDPISVEASGANLMVYRAGKRVKPRDLSTFIETAFEVATRFGG